MRRMHNLEKNFMSIPMDKMDQKKVDNANNDSEDSIEREKQLELR